MHSLGCFLLTLKEERGDILNQIVPKPFAQTVFLFGWVFLFGGGFPLHKYQVQKNPRVRKIFVRNSGAGNGCANFMGA